MKAVYTKNRRNRIFQRGQLFYLQHHNPILIPSREVDVWEDNGGVWDDQKAALGRLQQLEPVQ